MASAIKEEESLAITLEKDSRWQLVQRIVATPSFVRAPRLSSFLLYVCKQSISGQGIGLNEQSIGEIVFGRAVGYDSRDDNIVRSHASRLRLRLESYFQEEGSLETLRINIPRGSYVPLFERVSHLPALEISNSDASNSAHLKSNLLTVPPQAKTFWRNYGFLLTFALLASIIVVATVASTYPYLIHLSWYRQTPTRKLWSQMFRADQDTLIVPADISLVMAKLMSGHSVDLAAYASGRYKSGAGCESPCNRDLLKEVESRRYTSMADLEFAATVARLPESLPNRTRIRYVRDLQLEDLKQSNLIMAGSMVADPWLSLIEHEMNFVLHDDPETGKLRVENRRPKGNERSEYFFNNEDPQHRGVATIAFLPNLSGSGNLLIVQGSTLAGTEAAAEFVTKGEDFDALFHEYSGNGLRLPYFEILLGTLDINGMGARPNVLAWRTYP
jgi:hypothetical protein